MNISNNNYDVVLLPNGTPLTQGDQLCLQNKADGSIVFVELSEHVQNMFNIIITSEAENSNDNVNALQKQSGTDSISTSFAANESLSESESTTRVWSKYAVLTLIDLMKKYDAKFKSSTEKNEKVWRVISSELNEQNINVTTSQCRDKWKYLKMRYMKKKDNMSNRETGTQPIKFEYFREMNELLGSNHNVNPPAIAASLVGKEGPSQDEHDVLVEMEDPDKPKAKKRKFGRKQDLLETLVTEIKKSSEKREEHRQAEMRAKEEATRLLADKMDALINVLSQKK